MITFVRTYTRDICDYVLMNMNCLKDHMVIFIKYQIFPKQQKIQIKHRCSYIRCFVVGHGVMETLKYVIIAHIKCLLLTDKIKSLNKSKNFNYIEIIPIFASCSFECYCMNIPNIRHMSICIYLYLIVYVLPYWTKNVVRLYGQCVYDRERGKELESLPRRSNFFNGKIQF